MTKKKIKPPIKATKKEATALATWRAGKGIIRINSRRLELVSPPALRTYIEEPLLIAPEAGKAINIAITIRGGGPMSHAVAARACIAKAIVESTKDEKIRKEMLAYDRMLLVDDPRRVEPKKPLGPKARRKKQHSKR